MNFSGSLQSLSEWYGQRPLRERALLVLCILAALFFIWDTVVMNPISARKFRDRKNTEAVRLELSQLATQETVIEARKDFDPDRENRQLLTQLQIDVKKVRQQLEENVGNLVSPREMPELLKDLLSRQNKLQLLSLENLPAEALQINTQVTDGEVAPDLYRHRLRIEFAGDYLATLAYLKKLEQLPRRLVWEDLEIETQQYPVAKVKLQVYTLSLEKGWIGG